MSVNPAEVSNSSAVGNSLTQAQRNQSGVGSKELGKDEFLRMLMTQLSAQDPLNPMDSTQFTAQLSQFASLEQLTNLGSKLDSLIQINGANNAANAVSLLGKEVRMDSNQIKGPKAKVAYELDRAATQVQIEVRDKDNRVVHTALDQPGSLGLHEVNLDALPPGDYKVYVVAKDAANAEVRGKVSVIEKVTGVNFVGNVPQCLMESGATIPATSVLEIREPRAQGAPVL